MERRCFIGSAAMAAPLLGTVATAQEAAESSEKPEKRWGCKLTVVRRSVNQDLVDEHFPGLEIQPCESLKEGQEFVLEHPWSPPEGFCQWAWADIRTYIMANFHGGELPLMACCTDGLRPVYFKLERVELET